MADMDPRQPEIVTERLRLRALRPGDAGLIALYASDIKVARMTASIPHPFPPGAAESFIERVNAAASAERVWALDIGGDRAGGLIGTIGLKTRAHEAEVGYWVAAAFWNTGYATEAVEALAKLAPDLGLGALTAFVFQDNPASARVLTHAHFAYVGEGEQHSVARRAMVPTFRYRRELASGAR